MCAAMILAMRLAEGATFALHCSEGVEEVEGGQLDEALAHEEGREEAEEVHQHPLRCLRLGHHLHHIGGCDRAKAEQEVQGCHSDLRRARGNVAHHPARQRASLLGILSAEL